MLGVVSKHRRTIRMGGPAQPRRFRHAYHQPKRWKHTGHMQRNHHQRRGRYGRGPSDSCLSGDASDLKVPVAMVAEQRSRLGRQVNRTTKVREGFTAGHAAYRTRQIAQGSAGGGATCDSMPAADSRLLMNPSRSVASATRSMNSTGKE